MNNALLKTVTKPLKSHVMGNPFVCKYIPSICSFNPVVQPFVVKKIPNRIFMEAMRQIHGFTLIELVVTMTVAAILITVAVPNLRTFVQNSRIITQANYLKTDLAKARNKSIGSPSGIGLCKSTNGTTCVVGGSWAVGRAIFVDSNNNRQWDPGEAILEYREALVAGSTLTTTAAIPDQLVFFQAMISNLGAGTPSFILCDNRGPAHGKQIDFLSATGLATVNANAPGGC